MRLWKIAISLATLAALSAPFIKGSWKNPRSSTEFVYLTEAQANKISEELKASNNCETLKSLEKYSFGVCSLMAEHLKNGGYYQTSDLTSEYLRSNIIPMLVYFVVVFVFALTIPRLALIYWKWLKA